MLHIRVPVCLTYHLHVSMPVAQSSSSVLSTAVRLQEKRLLCACVPVRLARGYTPRFHLRGATHTHTCSPAHPHCPHVPFQFGRLSPGTQASHARNRTEGKSSRRKADRAEDRLRVHALPAMGAQAHTPAFGRCAFVALLNPLRSCSQASQYLESD